MRRALAAIGILLFVFVGGPTAVDAGELQDDLASRRARFMAELGPETMLVVFSAPVRTYSNDIEYEYRQDSNFYYLTGIEQPDSILVLMPGNLRRKEILFVLEPNPTREHWEGHMLRQAEATAQSGIATVYFAGQFEPFIEALLARRAFETFPDAREYSAFFAALAQNRARLSLVRDKEPALSGEPGAAQQFAAKVKDRFLGLTFHDATAILHSLRQVKTPYEQRVLQRSVEISSEAHLVGMRTARPGIFEYEVEAAIEATYVRNGAYGWGYPTIVGSGPNATILHYSTSRRRIEEGDLLLVDAAANYQYLTGDITRTYPVSGTFTDRQKDIYRIVLEAQDEAARTVRPGVTAADVHNRAVEVVKRGLLELGLITDVSGDQYRLWFTHGSVHWIGMDVHDVGDRNRPLEPGMAFVIEPGIYVRDGVLEALPSTPENRAFIEKVRPAFDKYKNIGVRVEDSFLLTETELKRLSGKVPRTIEEIERFLKSGHEKN